MTTCATSVQPGSKYLIEANCCRWQGCDDPKKRDDRFPADKQFLITRQVPCQKRIKEIESSAVGMREIEVEDGWVEAAKPEGSDDEVVDMDAQVVSLKEEEKVEEEEVFDMDAMMEEGGDNIFAQGNYIVKNEDEDDNMADNTQSVRKYDMTITYDFYHQTPRLWFLGYSE